MTRLAIHRASCAAATAFVLVGGCIEPGDSQPFPGADFDRFADEIQPLLIGRCGNPSCHGAVERPLEVYATHFHRLDGEDVYLDTPLSDEEVWLNYVRATSFIVDLQDAHRSLLLLKPLAVESGGAAHAGGAQFADADGREYALLLEWIEDSLREE